MKTFILNSISPPCRLGGVAYPIISKYRVQKIDQFVVHRDLRFLAAFSPEPDERSLFGLEVILDLEVHDRSNPSKSACLAKRDHEDRLHCSHQFWRSYWALVLRFQARISIAFSNVLYVPSRESDEAVVDVIGILNLPHNFSPEIYRLRSSALA
jgi:hypothetical protein